MNSILGRIEAVTCKDEDPASSMERWYRAQVKLTPKCVMPERRQIPEWLKEQVLSVTRVVSDPREIGAPGDSIVLTPSESARWLFPLTVSPSLCSGSLRGQIVVALRWWKDKKPPELEVKANGNVRKIRLSKKGDSHETVVDLADLFSGYERLPAEVLVSCDKLKATCTVFPQDIPSFRRAILPDGESWIAISPWVRLCVATDTGGAGIASLVERGRGVDHFSSDESFIQRRFEHAGHVDRLQFGWEGNKLADTSMSSSGARREGRTTRLGFVGTVDKDKGLRTTVSYVVHDDLPLIMIQRELLFCGEQKDDKKDAEKKPSEPIDDVISVSMSFRAAWRTESNGNGGSRVLAVEEGCLRPVRCVQPNERIRYNTFRLLDGWVIAEHMERRECMMYLFDQGQGPQIATGLSRNTMTLEPSWMPVPVHPGRGCGYTVGLVAGETSGAADTGGWIACRTSDPRGGVMCAVIARLRDFEDGMNAEFDISGSAVKAPLRRLSVPGIGELAYSTAWFPEGDIHRPLKAIVAGIPGR